MMKRWWMAAVAGLALALPAQAQQPPKPQAVPLATQAATSPLTTLYRIAGVLNNSTQPFPGVATYFSCSSFSSVNERLRVIVKNFDGAVQADSTFTVASRRNFTIITNFTRLAGADTTLLTGSVFLG